MLQETTSLSSCQLSLATLHKTPFHMSSQVSVRIHQRPNNKEENILYMIT